MPGITIALDIGGTFTDVVARRPDGGLDPAGFVKGWAAQRASHLLTDAGFTDWFLGVGGDIQTRGLNADSEPWSVEIGRAHV